ncbi:MAG: hypothetical protein LBC99_08585 [Spirochaetota bacterium]|nr:hypothetical protein [Spirochaetota bacterium]
MYIEINCNPSAFKHGVTENDIRWAIKTHICDVLMDGYENKYALIGFDTSGNLLEIMYNLIDEHSINVFHAMKCRESFRSQFGL